VTSGTATVNGTLTLMPAFYTASAAATQVDQQHVGLIVTSLRGTDSCAAVQTSADANVASVFQVVVALDSSDARTVMAPGTYSLGDGWQASYQWTDQACVAARQEATTGTLEIDTVGTSVQGIADMTFPSGRVIVRFDAPFCQLAVGGGSPCASFPPCPQGEGTDLNPAPTETCIQFPQ
jgi:hypothetical protein